MSLSGYCTQLEGRGNSTHASCSSKTLCFSFSDNCVFSSHSSSDIPRVTLDIYQVFLFGLKGAGYMKKKEVGFCRNEVMILHIKTINHSTNQIKVRSFNHTHIKVLRTGIQIVTRNIA
jgi:hypothetical protein